MRKEFRYGAKVRECREERAWTQEHLAEAAAIQVRTVQRVEKNLTQNPETLQAIAGAFDVDLSRLRTTWLIPESKLLRTFLVTTYEEFLAVEEAHRHSAFARMIVAPLAEDVRNEIQKLFNQVFADRECIEPDEPELWQSYVEWIKEPIDCLFDRGFVFFLLDESRDLLLSPIGDLKPIQDHIKDWRVRYFMLVPRNGCFRLSNTEPLHRFNQSCEAAANVLLRRVREVNVPIYVYSNALWAVTAPGEESRVSWCDTCFPRLSGGVRITFEYIEEVTGLSRAKLHAICDAVTGQPFLEGLA